jgi:hypothetical protein
VQGALPTQLAPISFSTFGAGLNLDVFQAVGVATAVLPLVLLLGRRTGHLPRWVGVLLVAAYAGAAGWLFLG